MSFTIGHTVFTNGPDSGSIVRSGGQIAFMLDINLGSLSDTQAADQQLRGYAEMGNPVPVIWQDDPTWDGYYVFTSVSVSPIENYLGNGVMSAQLTMQLSPGTMEVMSTYSSRPIDQSSVTPTPIQACPRTANFRTGSTSTSAKNWRSLVGGLYSEFAPREATYQYDTKPGDFYVGAAIVEELYDGEWHIITGTSLISMSSAPSTRSAATSVPAAPAAANYRISNGLIRVSILGTGIKVEVGTPAAWQQVGVFETEIDETGGALEPTREPRVLRNNPLEVTLRYPMRGSTVTTGSDLKRVPFLDVTVQRGQMFVSFLVSDLENFTDSPTFGSATTVACTSVTGGIHSTSADSNGHRWVAATDLDIQASDLTDGGMTIDTSVVDSRDYGFMIGVNRDAETTADEPGSWTVGEVISQYWGAVAEDQIAVKA